MRIAIVLSLATLMMLCAPGCRRSAKKGNFTDKGDGLKGGKLIFQDNFNRQKLNAGRSDWRQTTGRWVIKNNALHNNWDKNGGVWWNGRLPRHVRIEFTAWSANPPEWLPCQRHPPARSGKKLASFQADIKFEVFNSRPEKKTGYSCVYGGWLNHKMIIGRKGEHAPRVPVVELPKRDFWKRRVIPGRKYKMTIVRTDKVLRWYVDNSPQAVLVFDDPKPLQGAWFGFNNWCAHVFFDDLKIYKL